MVHLSITINARTGKRGELLSSLRQFFDNAHRGRGYLDRRISQDIDNENQIYIDETWHRRSDLDEYLRSDLFSALLGAVKLLGETHAIQINECSRTDGLEAVQAARSMKA